MSGFSEGAPQMLVSGAVQMWLDHGARPEASDVPVADLRLTSGLPFSLYAIDPTSSQEGAIVVAMAGDPEELAQLPDGPLVRMHSACIFSEFGDSPQLERWLARGDDPSDILFMESHPSGECDCRAQRLAAQQMIANEGGIYFDLAQQEGRREQRGQGLAAKHQIYHLQQLGLNTVEACHVLGVAVDERDQGYRACAAFLGDLGIGRVRLLSNNDRKVNALEAADIAVTRVPLVVGVTADNIGYLSTKRDRLGHAFPDEPTLGSLIGEQ